MGIASKSSTVVTRIQYFVIVLMNKLLLTYRTDCARLRILWYDPSEVSTWLFRAIHIFWDLLQVFHQFWHKII